MTEAETRQNLENPTGGPSGIRWRPFAAVIICLMVFDVTMGLSYPLLSLLLEGRGVSPFLNGLNASMLPLGLVLSAPLSLFPLYGPRRGLDEATASYLLGVLIAGNIVLQFPLGWLADVVGRRRVLSACALATVLGALVLPAAIGTPWQWPLVPVWGTAGFGIYTLALADLGDRFTGAELLAGTAALTAMFGLGGIAGPTLGGAAMQHFGPEGLPVMLAGAYGLLLVVSVIRGRR